MRYGSLKAFFFSHYQTWDRTFGAYNPITIGHISSVIVSWNLGTVCILCLIFLSKLYLGIVCVGIWNVFMSVYLYLFVNTSLFKGEYWVTLTPCRILTTVSLCWGLDFVTEVALFEMVCWGCLLIYGKKAIILVRIAGCLVFLFFRVLFYLWSNKTTDKQYKWPSCIMYDKQYL